MAVLGLMLMARANVVRGLARAIWQAWRFPTRVPTRRLTGDEFFTVG